MHRGNRSKYCGNRQIIATRRTIALLLCLVVIALTGDSLAQIASQFSAAVGSSNSMRTSPSVEQLGDLKSLGKNVKVAWNRDNGTPIALSGSLGNTKNTSSIEEGAMAFISEHKALFKLNDPQRELKLHSHVSVQQELDTLCG